jgi:hypothetical protein
MCIIDFALVNFARNIELPEQKSVGATWITTSGLQNIELIVGKNDEIENDIK